MDNLKKMQKIIFIIEKIVNSKVYYKGCKQNICIICSNPLQWLQLADHHIRGHGCPLWLRKTEDKFHSEMIKYNP